jgi:uncharacterized protein (TIGR02246 family)
MYKLLLEFRWSRIFLAAIATGIVFGFSLFSAVTAMPPLLSENRYPGAIKVMKPEAIQSLIQSARVAWVKRDAYAWANLFVPDGEMIVHGHHWVGQDAIRKSLKDFAAGVAEVKIDIRRIMIEGNQAAVEWHWQDQDKASGRRSQADDAIVIDFKANRIARWREYIDKETPALR